MKKFAPLILLLLVGCDASIQATSTPTAAPTVQAAPAAQFGHLSPIQLPKGEFWDGWQVTPEVISGSGGMEQPEKYFFSTTTNNARQFTVGNHTLRNGQGVPVLIVKDPQF